MKTNPLLYLLLVFLILMNGFFLFREFKTSDTINAPRFNSASFIENQLEFDEGQLQKFNTLDSVHQKKLNTIRKEITASKDSLFKKVFENYDDAEIESITAHLAKMEKAKGLETFRFFNSISKMCNENQRRQFKEIIKDGLQRPGPKKGDRPLSIRNQEN